MLDSLLSLTPKAKAKAKDNNTVERCTAIVAVSSRHALMLMFAILAELLYYGSFTNDKCTMLRVYDRGLFLHFEFWILHFNALFGAFPCGAFGDEEYTSIHQLEPKCRPLHDEVYSMELGFCRMTVCAERREASLA